MTLSSMVTIGDDALWRQVHALLELAVERTPNIRQSPNPFVVQKQLSDFYVEYTLIAEAGKRVAACRNSFQPEFSNLGGLQ
jgi:hypothetical protein